MNTSKAVRQALTLPECTSRPSLRAILRLVLLRADSQLRFGGGPLGALDDEDGLVRLDALKPAWVCRLLLDMRSV